MRAAEIRGAQVFYMLEGITTVKYPVNGNISVLSELVIKRNSYVPASNILNTSYSMSPLTGVKLSYDVPIAFFPCNIRISPFENFARAVNVRVCSSVGRVIVLWFSSSVNSHHSWPNWSTMSIATCCRFGYGSSSAQPTTPKIAKPTKRKANRILKNFFIITSHKRVVYIICRKFCELISRASKIKF